MRVNRDLAGQIVFEFSQEALAKAGVEGEKNLTTLATMGFALSMDHVESLALDFLRLKAIGFRHLKVHASILTRGMNGAGAQVAAEDFKKLLTRHGLNLIAERVEDEKHRGPVAGLRRGLCPGLPVRRAAGRCARSP